MAKHTNLVAPLTKADLERLQLIRLARGWSFREMAQSIDIPETTLKAVLQDSDRLPRETTVYKVRLWLDAYVEPEAAAVPGEVRHG